MSCSNRKITYLAAVVALCTANQLVAPSMSQQSAPQSAASLASNVPRYFPEGTSDRFADFYSTYLNSIGEPSLFAAAQDPNGLSYRLICLYCQKPNLLVVRLTLSPDGTVKITTTKATLPISGLPVIGDKTQLTAIGTEVDPFFRLIEKADFWSMPTNVEKNPKVAKMDAAASRWVFEGVRGGTYHVVFREGPEPGPFTNMVRFLAKNLAKLDDSAVPRAIS
jgi:hypothetical protein